MIYVALPSPVCAFLPLNGSDINIAVLGIIPAHPSVIDVLKYFWYFNTFGILIILVF